MPKSKTVRMKKEMPDYYGMVVRLFILAAYLCWILYLFDLRAGRVKTLPT